MPREGRQQQGGPFSTKTAGRPWAPAAFAMWEKPSGVHLPGQHAPRKPQCPKHAAAQAEPIEGEQRANLPQNVPGLFGIIPNIPPKPQIYHHAGGKFRRSDEGSAQRRLEHDASVRKSCAQSHTVRTGKGRPARPLSSGCGRARQSPARCSLRHPQKIVQLFASCIFHPPFSATRGAAAPVCMRTSAVT